MSKYKSPALEKGLDILEYLSLKNLPQSQIEIANGINKTPNEIYRMLICLEKKEYIHKDQASNRYSLTLKLYYLSHRHPPVNALRMAALGPMQELSESVKQSSHLSILYKNDVLVIAQSLTPGPISLSIEDGSRFSVYKTTSGRIILSQFDSNKQLVYLNRNKNFKALSKDKKTAYLKEIEKITQEGFDIRESEETHGVLDIVVPLSIPEIQVTGALAITILFGGIQTFLAKDKILKNAKLAIEQIYRNLGVDTIS